MAVLELGARDLGSWLGGIRQRQGYRQYRHMLPTSNPAMRDAGFFPDFLAKKIKNLQTTGPDSKNQMICVLEVRIEIMLLRRDGLGLERNGEKLVSVVRCAVSNFQYLLSILINFTVNEVLF